MDLTYGLTKQVEQVRIEESAEPVLYPDSEGVGGERKGTLKTEQLKTKKDKKLVNFAKMIRDERKKRSRAVYMRAAYRRGT